MAPAPVGILERNLHFGFGVLTPTASRSRTSTSLIGLAWSF
jgi:hypothetical protein